MGLVIVSIAILIAGLRGTITPGVGPAEKQQKWTRKAWFEVGLEPNSASQTQPNFTKAQLSYETRQRLLGYRRRLRPSLQASWQMGLGIALDTAAVSSNRS